MRGPTTDPDVLVSALVAEVLERVKVYGLELVTVPLVSVRLLVMVTLLPSVIVVGVLLMVTS